MASYPVVIVGGGIAGLSAALRLQARGTSFLLLDGSARLGGVIATEIVDGFLLERGPDAIFAHKPEGVALSREVGLGPRLQPTEPCPAAVYVLHQGRLHALPEGMNLGVPTRLAPMVASPLFSWRGKLRMGLEPFIPAAVALDDESIASFMGRRLGQEVVERIAEPLLAGIHAGDPARLSVRSTLPLLRDLERRHGSLLRGLRSARRQAGAGPAFLSFPRGLGELVHAVVGRLPAASLRPGVSARTLRQTAEGYEIATSAGETLRARSVILAVPPRAAAHLLETVDLDLSARLVSIPSVSTAVVYFGLRREDVAHPLTGHGFLVPRGEGLRLTACTFVSSKFAGRAPAGTVLLRAFLGGAREPQVLAASDAELASAALSTLEPVLGLRGTPLLQRVFRWSEATPQLEVGHHLKVDAVEAAVARHRGLLLTGAGLRGTGIADMVADGARQAAAAVLPEVA